MGYAIEPVTHLAIASWPNDVGSPCGVGLTSEMVGWSHNAFMPLLLQWDTSTVGSSSQTAGFTARHDCMKVSQ